jgi:hypothetical protein
MSWSLLPPGNWLHAAESLFMSWQLLG